MMLPSASSRPRNLVRVTGMHGVGAEKPRPVSGWGSLTPAERRVVSVVAGGLTKAEIAHQLVISTGTVKSHLTPRVPEGRGYQPEPVGSADKSRPGRKTVLEAVATIVVQSSSSCSHQKEWLAGRERRTA
jgi:FixJ family two-component response regulator